MIYQITIFPIEKDEYLKEEYFYDHWFLGSIADNVSEIVDREEELCNLRDRLEINKIAAFNKDGSFTFLPAGKKLYFARKYENFIESIQKASQMSLDEFIDDTQSFGIMSAIKNNYCDNYDSYVFSDDCSVIPLDEYIRVIKPGVNYYIGGILAYHR